MTSRGRKKDEEKMKKFLIQKVREIVGKYRLLFFN